MNVHIAGTGKLATELLQQLSPTAVFTVSPWSGEVASGAASNAGGEGRAIVVHAGSGRELGGIVDFCQRTGSVLVELATGSALEGAQTGFPVVLCPNTNLLMLKFMCMLERSGALFQGSRIRVTESHQASKASVPGTAVAMAQSLGVAAAEIHSVRDPAQQLSELGIPPGQLARHAVHRIEVDDGLCSITMETRVLGEAPYAQGVQRIIEAICQRELPKRVHTVTEFIENGWV